MTRIILQHIFKAKLLITLMILKKPENYETAIDIEETFIDALYYLAKLLSGGVATDKEGTLVDKTDLPSAKKHLLKVLEMDENHARACYNLGKILCKEDKLKEAQKFLGRALKIDPKYSKAHFLLAHVKEF